jgi:hypothetical protein
MTFVAWWGDTASEEEPGFEGKVFDNVLFQNIDKQAG